MVPHAGRIEPRGAPFYGHFADQTRPHQVPQVVIDRRPGRSGINAVNAFEDLRRRGMPGLLHQERHDGIALRSTPETAARQGSLDVIRKRFMDAHIEIISNFGLSSSLAVWMDSCLVLTVGPH